MAMAPSEACGALPRATVHLRRASGGERHVGRLRLATPHQWHTLQPPCTGFEHLRETPVQGILSV
jgi:hypothetical protein